MGVPTMGALIRRQNLYIVIAAVSVLTAVQSAVAQNVPRYDPEAYCKTLASTGGAYSAIVDNTCIQQEQQAYDALNTTWDTLPAQAQTYCDHLATVGGEGSYIVLQACIQQEMHARSNAAHFHY